MHSYSVREVCRSLGIRPHVLRYWEDHAAIVTPMRTDSGHRRWSSAQVNLLHRMKHLIVDLGMSVAAAEQQLIREASHTNVEGKARIERFRSTLVALKASVHPSTEEREYPTADNGEAPAPQSNLLPPLPDGASLPVHCDCPGFAGGDGAALVFTDHLRYRKVGAGPALIAESPGGRTLLSVAAAVVRSETLRRGTEVPWLVVVREDDYGAILDYLDGTGWFGLSPSYGTVIATAARIPIGSNVALVPPAVVAIDRLTRSDQARAWLTARNVGVCLFPSASGIESDRVMEALVRDDDAAGVVLAASTRRRVVAALDVRRLCAYRGDPVFAGQWRREVYSIDHDAENRENVWVFEMTAAPAGRHTITMDEAFPARRPAPWSPRWTRELDLI